MPWANDGGASWNATRCSPIAAPPGQAGEPCTVEGSAVSGIDTCDLGLMCWGVDPTTLEGTCESMCTGSPDNPICPDGYSCKFSGDGSLAICLFDCDPLAQDCAEGQCIPLGDTFACAASTDTAAPGQACGFASDCDLGAACLDASLLPECTDTACCAAFCDLGAADPDAICGPQTSCVPWYTEAPPGYEDLGVCVDPEAV